MGEVKHSATSAEQQNDAMRSLLCLKKDNLIN